MELTKVEKNFLKEFKELLKKYDASVQISMLSYADFDGVYIEVGNKTVFETEKSDIYSDDIDI